MPTELTQLQGSYNEMPTKAETSAPRSLKEEDLLWILQGIWKHFNLENYPTAVQTVLQNSKKINKQNIKFWPHHNYFLQTMSEK